MRVVAYLGAVGVVCSTAALLWLGGGAARGAAWTFAVVLPFYACGVLASWKRPDLPVSRLLLLAGALWAVVTASEALLAAAEEGGGGGSWLWPARAGVLALSAAALAATGTLFALFPDGRIRSRLERRLVAAIWAVLAVPPLLMLTSPTPTIGEAGTVDNPIGLVSLPGFPDAVEPVLGAPLVIGVALLAMRYRRFGAEQRRQVRWLLTVPCVGLLAAGLAALVRLDDSGSAAVETAVAVGGYLLLAAIPAAIVVAILRHNLLDVDVLLRKSIIFAALWFVIGGSFVALAAALGIAASSRLPVAVAILVAVAATLAFQPARKRIERKLGRRLFGERSSDRELLTRVGATLEQAFDPAELVSHLAETVRRGLNVSWVRVSLGAGPEQSGDEPAAVAGAPAGAEAKAALRVPLSHAGEQLGAIECGPRSDGALVDRDREILEHLARQAALAIHNVRLTAELAAQVAQTRRQAAELSMSRARVVQAADAERRRIERNIHDGVQQELVALIAKLRLARNQLVRDAATAEQTLGELQAEAAMVLDDLRELAQGIHPSVLSDCGLVEAIEARAGRLPLEVALDADGARGRRYGDEIEGAAYFLVSEGLANALKHAAARRLSVRLREVRGRLVVEVADDGAGFDAQAAHRRGLANLRDRLEALGGSLRIESYPGAGTRLLGELPAPARETADA